MKIDIEKNRGWTVLRLNGALDAASAGAVQGQLLGTLDEGGGSFLLDLENVTSLDSSGLAALVRFYKEIRTRGGTLALCALQRDVLRMFEVTKLNTIFTIFPDSDVARAA